MIDEQEEQKFKVGRNKADAGRELCLRPLKALPKIMRSCTVLGEVGCVELLTFR